jgi:CRP-like cAMP-binding protein
VAEADIVDSLARLALFADLGRPQLVSVAHAFEEEVFPAGKRVLREGLSGSAVYLILDGEARVEIGDNRVMLGRGEFFGEISVLTGEPPNADVVSLGVLRCFVIPGPELAAFLLERPAVMLRLLQSEARRVRDSGRWGR